ncbi:MAG: phage tail sheath subtilisin-like domain-containing protein [Oscillospiraceae bacterium]|nr:phage tail sheath subtilisin-like domain-containing protein [Oscillospiraceae bacterium]
MSITVHERPGVYTSYEATAMLNGSAGRKCVGLAVKMADPARKLWKITRYEQAVAAFGQEQAENATALVRLLLQNGAAQVTVFPVEEENYAGAFAAMAAAEDLAVVVCDSTDLAVQQALRDSVNAASTAQRERIAVVAGDRSEGVDALVTRAAGLNCERVVLAAPGCVDGEDKELSALELAAAMAGAVAGLSDPAVPLGGAQLMGLHGLAAAYSDEELDVLIRGGVTVAESVAGVVSVVRGVTTRTTMAGATDSTWRDLSAVLVVDDVIPAIRNALKSRFRRAKNTAQSREAIRSQVVLELENKLEREIIAAYEGVSVVQDSEEPTRCLVDFSFTVTHGINQIWLSAHITV